jgi:protein O-mannosyl-transferase
MIEDLNWRRGLPHFALVIAVALVWGQCVLFGFVWDDTYFVEELESIRSLKNVPAMFWSLDAQSSYPDGFVLFRPLRTMHYAILYALGGGPPPQAWLFHLANLIWHSLVVLLLYLVLGQLLRPASKDSPDRRRGEWIAFMCALGFAVNPAVSEVVCWVKCLDDLMAAAFTLAAALALLRWRTGGRQVSYWASVVFFVLALYSKVSAVPFAVVVFLILHQLKRESLAGSLRRGTPFLVSAAIFLVHRHLVIGRTSQSLPLSGSYVQTLIDTLATVPIYLRLAVGVPPFCADYDYLQGGHPWTSGQVLLGGVLLATVMGLALTLLLKRKWNLLAIGLTWSAVFMLPVSNLVPTMQYMAERFLYLPVVGGVLAVAALSYQWKVGRMGVVLGSLMLLFWSTTSWQRSWIWQDQLTLFLRTSLECPKSERVEINAIAAAFQLPHLQSLYRAIRRPGQLPLLVIQDDDTLRSAEWPRIQHTLQQLLQIYPTNATVLTALGFVSIRLGRSEEARDHFDAAVRSAPTNPVNWHNLGLANWDSDRLAEAEACFKEALQLDPHHTAVLKSLSKLYWQQESFEAARPILIKLQTLEPENADHTRWLDQAVKQLELGNSVTP